MTELTLGILDELRRQIPRNEIVGFVVSPADYRSIRKGDKVLYGMDDDKIFVSPPFTGIELYVSNMIEDGEPLPLTKKMKRPLVPEKEDRLEVER